MWSGTGPRLLHVTQSCFSSVRVRLGISIEAGIVLYVLCSLHSILFEMSVLEAGIISSENKLQFPVSYKSFFLVFQRVQFVVSLVESAQ